MLQLEAPKMKACLFACVDWTQAYQPRRLEIWKRTEVKPSKPELGEEYVNIDDGYVNIEELGEEYRARLQRHLSRYFRPSRPSA